MSIFENSIIVVMSAAGTIEEGLIGYQECSGHAELGAINIDIESHGMPITGYDGQMIFTVVNNNGEEISHIVFNSMTGSEGYDKFVSDIGGITRRSKAGVKKRCLLMLVRLSAATLRFTRKLGTLVASTKIKGSGEIYSLLFFF